MLPPCGQPVSLQLLNQQTKVINQNSSHIYIIKLNNSDLVYNTVYCCISEDVR